MSMPAQPPPSIVIVAPRPPNTERHARERRDGRRNGGRHRADQNVAMQHVAQLVRHYAFEFAVVHQPENARR